MEMDETQLAKLKLTGVVLELQAFDMNEEMESLTQLKPEMMGIMQT